jgi:hypothetical protein
MVLAITATVFGLHLSSMQGRLTAAEQRDGAQRHPGQPWASADPCGPRQLRAA